MANKETNSECFISAHKMTNIVNLERSRTLCIIALVLLVLFFTSTVRMAYSAEATDLKTGELALGLRPLAIIDYSLGPGGEFDVNVTALNVTGLHGFRLTLTYDPGLIECKSVQEGDLLGTDLNTTIVSVAGDIYVSTNLTSPEAVSNGNGTLVKLKFHVLGRGETSLHLHDISLYDPNGASLSYTLYDGYFNNKFLIDIAMPLTLLAVTLASVFLNQKTEGKLKTTLEDKEFKVRDTVMLVALMVVMISTIVFLRGLVTPLMILYLFSFSTLLFIFTYLYSKRRWYVAVLPPAVFVALYLLLRDTLIWGDYLLSIYGIVFAILITLYVASLFSWKPTLIFAGLLTIIDIILVLVTGTMIQAVNTAFVGLSLPVVVGVPVVPPIVTAVGARAIYLGLGDFFFAGLLAIQTFKRFGKSIAVTSVIGMATSFFVWETFQLTFWKVGFPGTVMIICGWLPVAIGMFLKDRFFKA